MDKKLRNQLSEQIGVAIAAILKPLHDEASGKLEKQIRSASKDLAKKFLKAKKDIIRKIEENKKKARKVVKKVKASGAKSKSVRKIATDAPVKKTASRKSTRRKK